MDTSGQNHLEGLIVALLIYVNQVIGVNLAITASPEFPLESTVASLTCHIPSFTGGAEWKKNGSSLTQCQSGSCIPPSSTHYQYSTNATSITVTIPSLDIAQDEGTWTCAHNGGADTGVYNLTVYKIPSILSINGPTSSTLSDSVTVHLSVSTGCIHPSGPEHYNIAWKYVEAGSAAEKLVETSITQTFVSVGGCTHSYEDNLMLNLYLTNRMNPGTTTLYISQIKMTFTMAGRNVSALLNVAYNVTPIYTVSMVSSSSNQLGLGLGIGFSIPCVIAIIIVVWLTKRYGEENRTGFSSRSDVSRRDVEIQMEEKGLKSSRSDVSRRDVEIQMEEKRIKGDEERVPGIHNGTQNKVVSKATSKKASDRPHPLPPETVVSEDIKKHRPQPPPPDNSDVKDPNKRGISANFDDKQGLPPLTPKRSTVEEDDAWKGKHKKKKKKKKEVGSD